MNRSLQLILLSWLASLAAIGAAGRPTLDTMLFAAAVVLGTVLLFARDRLISPDPSKSRALVGHTVGLVAAWGAVAVRVATPLGARMPPRLGPMVLTVAASIVTLVWIASRVFARSARPRVTTED